MNEADRRDTGKQRAAARALQAGWDLTGQIEPLGRGHINDTFLVGGSGQAQFVLQRINQRVFRQPTDVLDNQQRVVAHLAAAAPGLVPPMLAARNGSPGWTDPDGDTWKLTAFVTDGAVRDTPDNHDVRAAARAFARYRDALATLPGNRLVDPIEHFLQLDHYLAAWDATPTPDDPAVLRWTALIDAHRGLADTFSEPEGYIHADCKIDNVLFRGESHVVAAVIDLDTTMWGHWAWDFGDLVRSAAVNEHGIDIARFDAALRGYLTVPGQDGELAGATEESLVLAPRYMAFCLAVRFLTDHCRGDEYFKVARRGENLARAAAQFRALESMVAQNRAMGDTARRALIETR